MATAYTPMPARMSRAPADAERPRHLYFAENMRAVAITLVVATHCFGLAWGQWITAFHHDPVASFVGGATNIFVFMSGFFFHHVFRSDFRYFPFLARRAKALLPPYVMISLLLLLIERAMGIDGERYGTRTEFLDQLIWALVEGKAGPAMWFVPFIFDIFLLSPLFLLFMRATPAWQCVVLGALIVPGLVFERDVSLFGDVAHFSFFYALGIFCSIHHERFVALARRTDMIVVSALAVALLIAMQNGIGMSETRAQASAMLNALDLVYFQKIALILLLAGLMLLLADRQVPGMTLIARWSFGIFFVHQLAMLALLPAAEAGLFAVGPAYFRLFLASASVFLLSVAIVWAVKRLLGKRSRLLIGA